MLELLNKYRMDLHRIPEIALKEFKTSTYIKQVLKSYKCEALEVYKTSVLAFFNKQSSETIAFRADMDALKINEKTGLDFSSLRKGYMHACGHDGHMSVLLGLAKYINDNYNKLDKNILLIFQPAEETIGGAQGIIKTNILSELNVKEIYGLHLWPGLEKGILYSKPGFMMSNVNEINITVLGKSIHIANYQNGIDALEIGCLLVTKLYNKVNELKSFENKILKFGIFESGTVINAISDKTLIKGSIRTYDQRDLSNILEIFENTKVEFENIFKCKINYAFKMSYPALRNSDELFSKTQKLIGLQELSAPVMQSEDFAFYSKSAKSLFMFLGVGNETNLHKSNFDFDSKVLLKGLEAFIKIINQ